MADPVDVTPGGGYPRDRPPTSDQVFNEHGRRARLRRPLGKPVTTCPFCGGAFTVERHERTIVYETRDEKTTVEVRSSMATVGCENGHIHEYHGKAYQGGPSRWAYWLEVDSLPFRSWNAPLVDY